MGDIPASIVRIDVRTGEERHILSLDSDQEPFAVSPNATSMAIVDVGPSSFIWGTELVVASIEGDDIRHVHSAGDYVRGLAWSPDSAHLAFLADDRIYRVDLADLSVAEIGDAPTNAHSQGYREMRWSPDGLWLAFSGENYQAIHVVPSDGSRAPVLFAEGGSFDWSPHGDELAFVHFDGLSAARADGTALRDLIVEDPEAPLVAARWRPDGEAIAVLIGEWSPGALCVLRADGGLHRAAGYVDLEGRALEWSPDGTQLLFGMVGNHPDGSARPLTTVADVGGDPESLRGDLLYPQWIPGD
jgi:Tol biopolymer transport system component